MNKQTKMILTLIQLLVIKFCCALGADINHHRLDNETESNYNFPVPQIENVYQAWKPIDYGHPLVDPTLHYVPPPLEIVQIGHKDKSDYYHAEDEYEGHGISDNKLNAMIYSSEKSKEISDELHMERAKQQSKVVKAVPGPYIADASASPRLDLGDIRRYPISQEYQPLKSGMYYVDDPHEEFREKERPMYKHQRYGNHLQESDRRQHWSNAGLPDPDVYIPVSLLSTPPTITPTRKPYGEIVNKDFFDKLNYATTPSPQSQYKSKNPRKVGPRDVVATLPHRGSGDQSLFPLGAPQQPARRFEERNANPVYKPRLEGVLGPPRPDVYDSPGFVDRRSSIVAPTWEPQNVSYYIEDREVVYPRNTMVYNTDTKSQVSQFSEAPEYQGGVGHAPEYQGGGDPMVRIPQHQQHVYKTEPVTAKPKGNSILEKAGMAMKHIAGMAGLPGAKPITEQHKFQLIYSREPAQIDTQSLEFDNGLSQQCLHGLPSFLKYLCVERQRTDRSSFSERSDQNIDDLMFIDTAQLNSENLKEFESLSQNIPEYRSFQADPETTNDESEVNPYQLVQDTQYGTQVNTEGTEEIRLGTELPFPYVVEDANSQAQDKEIIYSVAGGNVAVYKPDLTTTPTTTTTTTIRTTSTTTLTTTTTTDTPAIPYQYQPPLPGLTPQVDEQQAAPIRRRPLVYNKRQKTGSAVSRPFEYISKLKNIINERIFRPRPAPPVPRADRPSAGLAQEPKPGRRDQLITRRVPGRKFFFF